MSLVFFSNLPKEYPQTAIRELFARCGHVVSLRMGGDGGQRGGGDKRHSAAAPADALTTSGLIEFSDEASAQAAIATYNGFMLDTARGSTRLRVTPAQQQRGENQRRRQRDDQPNQHHRRSNDDDPLAASLEDIEEHQLLEAVEQLRVLAAEQPDRARALLDTFPQLRRAVTLVLQRNGKLPQQLPPQAFVPDLPVQPKEKKSKKKKKKKNKKETSSDDDDSSSSSGDDADDGDKKNAAVDDAAVDDEEIQSIISELSPDALQQLLSTDFENQPGLEPSVRAHFLRIQKALLTLSAE